MRSDSPPLHARAFWVTGPGRGELRSEQVPSPREDQVLVETRYSGISRGTESLVYQGRVPVSEYARMRAPHQEGTFPAPVKYGYCSVGVVRGGNAAFVGRDVFALFPHQTHFTAPVDAVVPIPDAVPAGRAVLAANMETAINGTWDAELLVGERVGVVGAGVVGCLVAYLARRVIGCEVQLIDVDERKRTIAERLGLEFVTGDRVRGDLDCVFDTSGAPAGLRHALELAGTEARVVVMSWFGEGPVALPLGGAFHANRLRLVSSQVGGLPPHQRPRWTYRRRLELALRLLGDDDLDVLVSSESAFENLPATMEALSDPSSFVLCHRVVYG